MKDDVDGLHVEIEHIVRISFIIDIDAMRYPCYKLCVKS